MSAARVPCLNPDCRNTILPATAKANDGLCAPCVGEKNQAARDEYIRLNRRTVDLYSGVEDPVVFIRIMLTRRGYDPLVEYLPSPRSIEEIFSQLTQDQIMTLANLAATVAKDGEEDFADSLGCSLAVLTSANLDDMLHEWLDANHYYPSIAFRNAGASVRDKIITAINSGRCNMNLALMALAWIGDETVQKQFDKWERNPPSWRKALHVGPAVYAETGGWELVGESRRNLFYEDCYALVPCDACAMSSEVGLLTETAETCPWCGDCLVHLIEIPTNDPRLDFLEYKGDRLSVLTCESCTCYSGHVFARIDAHDTPTWHPANQRPSYLGDLNSKGERGPWHGLSVELRARTPIYAADWLMEKPATQIGGLPTWVQDTAYPKCPDCSRKMKFLAQLDNNQFKGWEGIYYAFWCSKCRNTATTYQQT